MIKEIKYLLFTLIIILFIFFSGKYYFSETNKKNSYRSLNTIDQKIDIFSEKSVDFVKMSDGHIKFEIFYRFIYL